MDALTAASSGMQASSTWLFRAASNIATSDGGPDPADVAAYVAAPLAFAANARVFDAAVSTTRCLLDVLA